MRKPTNTTAQDPIIHLAEAMIHGPNGGAIEAQEARGQHELVNSDVLPTEGSDDPAWAKMGVIFGAPVEGDPIFREVTLPAGWKKESTGHAMHSRLLDDKGRERAGIFYKAAFYDRRADIHPMRRFGIRKIYAEGKYDVQHEILDGEKQIFATAIAPFGSLTGASNPDRKAMESAETEQRARCAAWLVAIGFPNWDDASAHWDD